MSHYDSAYEHDYEEQRKQQKAKYKNALGHIDSDITKALATIPDGDRFEILRIKLREARLWAQELLQ